MALPQLYNPNSKSPAQLEAERQARIQQGKGLMGKIGSAVSSIGGAFSSAADRARQAQGQAQAPQTSLGSKINYQAPVPTVNAMGVSAKSPSDNIKPQSNAISPQFSSVVRPGQIEALYGSKSTQGGTQGGTQGASGAIDYTLHPGESVDAYNARISQARTGSAASAPASQSVPPPAQQGPTSQPVQQTNFQPTGGLYGQLITGLANRSVNPDYSQQFGAYQGAVQNLANFNQELAKQQAGIQSTPIPLEFQQGREQVLARQAASQQQALQQAVLQQQQAIGLAQTGQQIQQQGLTSAAGLAAPQPYGITNIPYNPVTGQYGGLAGNAAGGEAGNGLFGVGSLLQGQDLGAQYSQLSATQRQAQTLTSQLTDLIDKNPQINPSGLSFVNGLFQWGAGQVGDPKYQTFANLINDLVSRYSAILTPSGGNPTDTRLRIAQSLINAQASGQSIKQVVQDLDRQASSVINQLSPSATPETGAQGGNTFGSFFGQ